MFRRMLIIALRLVITFLFVPAVLVKFRNPVAWGELFTTWGYPSWGPVVVSSIGSLASWRSGFQGWRRSQLRR